MAWSLHTRWSGIGSNSQRSGGQGREEIGQREQRIHGDDRFADQDHGRTALPRCHPVRQETPRPIRELTAEPVATVQGPLPARDGQRLADERMPRVLDGDRAWKLRSM